MSESAEFVRRSKRQRTAPVFYVPASWSESEDDQADDDFEERINALNEWCMLNPNATKKEIANKKRALLAKSPSPVPDEREEGWEDWEAKDKEEIEYLEAGGEASDEEVLETENGEIIRLKGLAEETETESASESDSEDLDLTDEPEESEEEETELENEEEEEEDDTDEED